MSTVVIVGGGLAGAAAAQALRDQDFDGHVILFGAEDHLPYERPPLSKEFLAGAQELADSPSMTATGIATIGSICAPAPRSNRSMRRPRP